MDDMLMKNRKAAHHDAYLINTFVALRTYNMKLNTNNLTLSVISENFLDLMFHQLRIQSNPYKIHAVLEIESFNNL